MSYVRTKDGKIVKVNLEGDVFTSRYEIIGEPKDTIEELCDEFVFVSKTDKHIIFREDMFFPTPQEARGKMDCYGAIWTDKGLIYVTKMNDKGELELI